MSGEEATYHASFYPFCRALSLSKLFSLLAKVPPLGLLITHQPVTFPRSIFPRLHLFPLPTTTLFLPIMRYAFMGVIVATIVSFILVQASVDRNAFTKSCPSNKGTTRSYINYDLTQDSALEEWTTMGGVVFAGPDGAELTIHKQGDAPTIVTDFYIFYGEVSVEMKASTGTGIVSAVYMLSDDNDKIDWVGSIF